MPSADLRLSSRLLAGGGPGTPDPRVARSLTTPLIGQFDPAFTSVMDHVAALSRPAVCTANNRHRAGSGLSSAGTEAMFNTLLEPGDQVAIGGSAPFFAATADVAARYGARVRPLTEPFGASVRLVVVPQVDPDRCLAT